MINDRLVSEVVGKVPEVLEVLNTNDCAVMLEEFLTTFNKTQNHGVSTSLYETPFGFLSLNWSPV